MVFFFEKLLTMKFFFKDFIQWENFRNLLDSIYIGNFFYLISKYVIFVELGLDPQFLLDLALAQTPCKLRLNL